MRVAMIGCVVAALVALLSACGGGSSSTSASAKEAQHQADLYQIDQIERTWHKAISRHNVDLLMTLWAPDAVFSPIPGQTFTGKQQIRHFWTDIAKVNDTSVHWVLDTPAFKIRETVNGDKGTLYFECDHIDLKTKKVIAVTAADQRVARIGGRWLITNALAVSPELSS